MLALLSMISSFLVWFAKTIYALYWSSPNFVKTTRVMVLYPDNSIACSRKAQLHIEFYTIEPGYIAFATINRQRYDHPKTTSSSKNLPLEWDYVRAAMTDISAVPALVTVDHGQIRVRIRVLEAMPECSNIETRVRVSDHEWVISYNFFNTAQVVPHSMMSSVFTGSKTVRMLGQELGPYTHAIFVGDTLNCCFPCSTDSPIQRDAIEIQNKSYLRRHMKGREFPFLMFSCHYGCYSIPLRSISYLKHVSSPPVAVFINEFFGYEKILLDVVLVLERLREKNQHDCAAVVEHVVELASGGWSRENAFGHWMLVSATRLWELVLYANMAVAWYVGRWLMWCGQVMLGMEIAGAHPNTNLRGYFMF